MVSLLLLALAAIIPVGTPSVAPVQEPLVFATYAEDSLQVLEARILAASIRERGGRFSQAPLWVYVPADPRRCSGALLDSLKSLGVEVRHSWTPAEARMHPFAGKVYAAAIAEADACARAEILAWLDSDTIIWKEPDAFQLESSVNLGYRPVMHRLIGSLWEAEPDPFWSRVYMQLGVTEKDLFPMETAVDHVRIRPYVNAGLLVVRPQAGLLRRWPDAFERLFGDPVLIDMCRMDSYKHLFLHQAALAGVTLQTIGRDGMQNFTADLNYSLNLHTRDGRRVTPRDLETVVTMRYDGFQQLPVILRSLPEDSPFTGWLRSRLTR
jgi:hypothetical protein